MFRQRIAIGIVLAVAAALLFFVAVRSQRPGVPHGSAEQVAGGAIASGPGAPLPALWPAPSFSYVDQNGRRFTDRELRGHVWISDFIFTTCTSICPMMTASMAQLQKAIDNRSVEFVSFSVDPDHDTPEVLARYAKAWQADESRWHFLSTDKKNLPGTAAGMKTFVKPPDKDSPIQHSAVFLLVDPKGMVRGVYDSSDSEALDRLANDALTLAGTPPARSRVVAAPWKVPQSDGAANSPGAALYVRSGCLACHAQRHVAPPLEGRFGGKVLLAGGGTATMDEAYIRESILEPGAKITAGYPDMMPSYRGQLTDVEVDELVGYVKSLRGTGAAEAVAAAAQKGQVVDPVCGMEIEPGPETARVKYRGKTYYFCSDSCRRQFVSHPKKFLGSAGG